MKSTFSTALPQEHTQQLEAEVQMARQLGAATLEDGWRNAIAIAQFHNGIGYEGFEPKK